jgi:hypothetical protein
MLTGAISIVGVMSMVGTSKNSCDNNLIVGTTSTDGISISNESIWIVGVISMVGVSILIGAISIVGITSIEGTSKKS